RDSAPAWSPDGKTIAFTSERSGRPEIFVMSPDGGGQRTLTEGRPVIGCAHWSPDGRRIAFIGGTNHKPAIDVVNADGSGVRTLLEDTTYIGGLSWSPDGRKLVFASGRDHPAGELYVMNADGSGVK